MSDEELADIAKSCEIVDPPWYQWGSKLKLKLKRSPSIYVINLVGDASLAEYRGGGHSNVSGLSKCELRGSLILVRTTDLESVRLSLEDCLGKLNASIRYLNSNLYRVAVDWRDYLKFSEDLRSMLYRLPIPQKEEDYDDYYS